MYPEYPELATIFDERQQEADKFWEDKRAEVASLRLGILITKRSRDMGYKRWRARMKVFHQSPEMYAEMINAGAI